MFSVEYWGLKVQSFLFILHLSSSWWDSRFDLTERWFKSWDADQQRFQLLLLILHKLNLGESFQQHTDSWFMQHFHSPGKPGEVPRFESCAFWPGNVLEIFSLEKHRSRPCYCLIWCGEISCEGHKWTEGQKQSHRCQIKPTHKTKWEWDSYFSLQPFLSPLHPCETSFWSYVRKCLWEPQSYIVSTVWYLRLTVWLMPRSLNLPFLLFLVFLQFTFLNVGALAGGNADRLFFVCVQ